MLITVNFGLSNSLTREFPEGTTVGQVLANSTIMAALGYGENVVAKIDGSTQDNSRRLVDGDNLDLEVRANRKAIGIFGQLAYWEFAFPLPVAA